MNRKAVSGMMLTLLLIGMLTLAFNIQPVTSESKTWTVDDDGPADFTKIQEAINAASNGDTISVKAGTYYENVVANKSVSLVGENRSNTIIDGTFTGTVVTVTANNVNVSGFTIQNGGPIGDGIYLEDIYSSGSNISHNIITNTQSGIHVFASDNNTLINNIASNNSWEGIYLHLSDYNTLTGNVASNNGYGIKLYPSHHNTLTGNVASNNSVGIDLRYSHHNTLTGNVASNNGEGIWLYYSTDNNLTGNNVLSNNPIGIYLVHSSYNTLTSNTVDNPYVGIYLENSPNNTISGNDITNNNDGIYLDSSSNNTISGNNIIANNDRGIYLFKSSYNNIIGNNITNNWAGVWFSESSNNIISENKIANSNRGIGLTGSSSNIIYHNNFVNNSYQIYDSSWDIPSLTPSINVWDNGYPSGGNYWSDYEERYPNATEIDDSGIWDTPYFIDEYNQDNYPLMQPYHGPVRNLNTGQSYPTIQEAINNASKGDKIFVLSGTYYENVVVNKTVSLVGENKSTTIINGNGIGTVVDVLCQNGVNIEEFSVRDGYVGVGVTNSTSTVVKDLELSNTHWGVIFAYTNDSVIEDVTLLKSGIKLKHSSRNIIRHCKVKGYLPTPICSPGIYLWYISENNTLEENTLVNIDNYAIILEQSDGNGILSNLIMNNSYGLEIYYSRKNVVRNNTIVNSRYKGIYAYESVFHNKICDNMFVNNNIGISLCHHVSHNMIYHNNFLNNTEQVHLSESFNNTWDDGYPSGGNYWSDYTGDDFYSGPDQDEPSNDGIGDDPYMIDANNQDNYPLMDPWTPPTVVATANVAPDTLNLRSKGKWITCYIELPEGYDVSDIDVSTISLNETIPVSLLDVPAPQPVPTEIGDYDNDGIPDLMVKFNRAELTSYIYYVLGIKYGDVTLTVTGELSDRTPFEGSDTIRVMFAGGGRGGGGGRRR